METGEHFLEPKDIRNSCRSGKFTRQTSGQTPGYAQANLCILPSKYAFDFLLFCQRNPKPCPLLHVIEAGEYLLEKNESCDVRFDVPKYRVYRDGVLVEEVGSVEKIWSDDLVTFVIGCSFSFEEALMSAGIGIRHIEEKKNVPMYNTSLACSPAGVFTGNIVVSMRPLTPGRKILFSLVMSAFI